MHFVESTEPGVAMAMQFLGIGKAAFDRFLAPLVEAFAVLFVAVLLNRFQMPLPEVALDDFLAVATVRALF